MPTNTSQGDGSFLSRKFIITVIGLIAITIIALYCAGKEGLNGEHISQIATSIAGITGAYVIGQGYADGQNAKFK